VDRDADVRGITTFNSLRHAARGSATSSHPRIGGSAIWAHFAVKMGFKTARSRDGTASRPPRSWRRTLHRQPGADPRRN